MPTAAKYTKETFWAVAAKGAAFFFYYGLVYYLTRKMTVEVWGDWSAFLALLNIVLLVSDQGINAANKRYVAAARDTDELGSVIRATFSLRLVTSLLFTLVIAILIRPILLWLHQPAYIGLMQRSLVLIALYRITDYFRSLFEALHRLRFTFIVNALEHGLKLVLVIVLYRGGDKFVAIVTAFTIAVATALVGGIFMTLRAVPSVLTSVAPRHLMRQAYIYSVPVFLVSIGGFISLEIGTIMLRYIRTAYETGIYSAAKQIVMFLPHISLALSMGTIPGISVFDEARARAQRQLYYRLLGALAGVYSCVCLGLAAFALWGMRLFFRPEYNAAAMPLLALLPFVLFNAANIFSGNLMTYRGLAWQRSLNLILAIIANILLNWWLIPIWGAVGAATASSIAYMPYCVLNLRAAHKAFAVDKS